MYNDNKNKQTNNCQCNKEINKTNTILYTILGIIMLMGMLTFLVIWLCSDKCKVEDNNIPNEQRELYKPIINYQPTYNTPFKSTIDIKDRKLLSNYDIPTNVIINLCIWLASYSDNANEATYLLQLIINDVIYKQTFTAYELRKKYKINVKTDNNYKYFTIVYFNNMDEDNLINFVIELSPIIVEIYNIFHHMFNNKSIGINDKLLNYFLEFEISLIVDKNLHTELVDVKDITETDNIDNGKIECIIEIGDLGRYKLVLYKNSNYHYVLLKNKIGDEYEKTDIYLMETDNKI